MICIKKMMPTAIIAPRYRAAYHLEFYIIIPETDPILQCYKNSSAGLYCGNKNIIL